jgi:NAD(P)-dependent dehydrogenase (short-subunit alcohol dehydrogenase family)
MDWDIVGARVLLTGGTSGIGRAAAAELARRGAEVMITARDQAKGQAAAQAIRAETGVDVQVGLLDLSRLDSVRDFAADYTRTHDRLDVLVNNAGTMTGKRMQTPDGLEWTFGVNHLAPFLLTRLLSDLLVASAPSRVISVSSEVHHSAKQGLDLDDLQMTRGWSAQKAYAASKLATILMTVELDRRLADQGVTALAVHPGVVATNFGKGPEGRWLMRVMMTALGPLLKKPVDGAAPLVLLATAPDDVVDQSLYWSQITPAQPSSAARDPRAAAQIWNISNKLAGLA